MRSVICDRRGPVPEDDDAPATVSNEPGTPNLFSSNILAFAGAGADDFQRTPLAPRSPAVQPIRVWVGLNPPSDAELAAQAAEEDAAEAARKSKVKSRKAGKKAATHKTALPSGAIEDAKGKKGRASLTLKPVGGSDITKDSPKKSASKKSAKAN
jgi:D-alanyl-D-alanine carboxypeptidase